MSPTSQPAADSRTPRGLHRVLRLVPFLVALGVAAMVVFQGGLEPALLLVLFSLVLIRAPDSRRGVFYGAQLLALLIIAAEVLILEILPPDLSPGIGIPAMLAGVCALSIPAGVAGHTVTPSDCLSRPGRAALFAATFQVLFLCVEYSLFMPIFFRQYSVIDFAVTTPLASLFGLLLGPPAARAVLRIVDRHGSSLAEGAVKQG